MNNTQAHTILNAAKAGHPTSRLMIMQALKVTGDLDPIKRTENVPVEVTHAVPSFSQSDPLPPKNPSLSGGMNKRAKTTRASPILPLAGRAVRVESKDDEPLIGDRSHRRTSKTAFGFLREGRISSVFQLASAIGGSQA